MIRSLKRPKLVNYGEVVAAIIIVVFLSHPTSVKVEVVLLYYS